MKCSFTNARPSRNELQDRVEKLIVRLTGMLTRNDSRAYRITAGPRAGHGTASHPLMVLVSKFASCSHVSPLAMEVYVLRAFLKRSKAGIKTPTEDMHLIQRRLKPAGAD